MRGGGCGSRVGTFRWHLCQTIHTYRRSYSWFLHHPPQRTAGTTLGHACFLAAGADRVTWLVVLHAVMSDAELLPAANQQNGQALAVLHHRAKSAGATCVCMCVCVCARICVCMCVRAHACVWGHACVRKCTHTRHANDDDASSYKNAGKGPQGKATVKMFSD